MSGIFGTGKSKKTAPTIASGLQLQSSTYGSPIPIVYGTTRIAPNIIWYGNFTPIPVSSGGSGKGGLAGGGGKGGTTQYDYQVAVQLGLCEGPIGGVGAVYVDKSATSLSSLGLTLFDGSYPQAPWGFLSTNYSTTTESHTIPRAAPYAVTVNLSATFISNGGVNCQGQSTPFTRGTGANQYIVSGNSIIFNAANAGGGVIITSKGSFGQIFQGSATIPATAPYVVNVQSFPIQPAGSLQVTGTASAFSAVAGSPAINQYSESGGTYTFNAANAGQTVSISYVAIGDIASYQALGYNGIAHADNAAYQLGTSPQLPNHNFEVIGVGAYATAGLPDADPSRVITDLLTNAHYGAAFPPSRVGDLTAYQAYAMASGLWVSPAYIQQASAATMLDDIATATNSAFVWSSGVLSVVPYGDQAITANGYTYTPPSIPLYDLTDDDYMAPQGGTGSSKSTDPVQMVRKRAADQINSVKLECLDRNSRYNTAIIEAKDQAAINTFGLRQAPSKQTHLFCDLTAAQTSAQLQLQRQAIRNVYSFTVDQRYVLLDPMDIVTLTDSNLGLNRQWVRITEITENDAGSLSMVAEEYLGGTGHSAAYGFQAGSGFTANYNDSPGDPNVPVIFEPTAELAESLEVWLAVSGGSFWGGCDVWISYDNQTYKNAGRINGSARMGVLSSPLARVVPATTGQTIDPANTLAVDLSESAGILLSASQAGATALAALCYADGEYVSYQTATLVAAGRYDLTTLVRGAYGSPIGQHAAGSPFARLDDAIFTFPYTQDYIGSTIYIKLTSFNIYGGGEQSPASVNPYAFTLRGLALASPLPDVNNVRTSYVASITQIAWDEVADFRAVLYEIRKGASWNGAQILGRVAHAPINAQGDGTYWVAAYSQPAAGLQVYGENPQPITISGSQITRNVIASYDEYETGWGGSVGGSATVVFAPGSGNIVAASDYLGLVNVLNYEGSGYIRTAAGQDGTYEIPAGHEIDIGRVAPCNVLITWQSLGQNIYDNILTAADYLNYPDILDSAASGNVNIYPEIALSQDGAAWGPWQKYSAGAYNARKFKARLQLQAMDSAIYAILQSFVFAVDVPDRDDHYIGLVVAGGGTTITFQPDGSASPAPFNGGPAGSPTMPAIQVTVLNGAQGDTAVLSGVSLGQATIEIFNGGMSVARSANVLVQGY